MDLLSYDGKHCECRGLDAHRLPFVWPSALWGRCWACGVEQELGTCVVAAVSSSDKDDGPRSGRGSGDIGLQGASG